MTQEMSFEKLFSRLARSGIRGQPGTEGFSGGPAGRPWRSAEGESEEGRSALAGVLGLGCYLRLSREVLGHFACASSRPSPQQMLGLGASTCFCFGQGRWRVPPLLRGEDY